MLSISATTDHDDVSQKLIELRKTLLRTFILLLVGVAHLTIRRHHSHAFSPRTRNLVDSNVQSLQNESKTIDRFKQEGNVGLEKENPRSSAFFGNTLAPLSKS